MASSPFAQHPNDLGESYAAHFVNAYRFGLRMHAGAAVLVHAIFPFLFVQTGSRTMGKLHRSMTGRGGGVDWERHPII
jgi:hypothetical protein